MSKKLELLKKYVAVQADDHACWCRSETMHERYLQQELKRVAWLIEQATNDEIVEAIQDKIKDL